MKYNYKPLPTPTTLKDQAWPEDTLPLVSTRTMTFNHENYIVECIEGLLMQKTNFPVQLLIHDDASTDNTSKIIQEYANKYPNIIKAYFQKENTYKLKSNYQKFKNSRKEFFSWITGKYIALCEGDDYWTDPLKLQKQVDFLETNEEFVVCCHNAKIVDDEGILLQDKKLSYLNTDKVYTATELKKGAFLLTLSMVYKNMPEILDEIKKIKKLKNVISGDTLLISILGKFGKGFYMEDIQPAVYRVHDGGIWSTKKKDAKFFYLSRLGLFQALLILHQNDYEIQYYFSKKLAKASRKILYQNANKLSFSELQKSNLVFLTYHNLVKHKKEYKKFLKVNIKYLIRSVNLNLLFSKLKFKK